MDWRVFSKEPKFGYVVSEVYVLTEYDRHPDHDGAVVTRQVNRVGDTFGTAGRPFGHASDADTAAYANTSDASFNHLEPVPGMEEWFDEEDIVDDDAAAAAR